MRIEQDIKLGFKDVMIRPKRSTLSSRSQVSLDRDFIFLNSKKKWTGVPIIASNIDTVGTFSMCEALSKNKIFTAIHKYYSLEQWRQFLSKFQSKHSNFIIYTTGIKAEDEKKLALFVKQNPNIHYVCIDVANGYTQRFVNFVKQVREKYPQITIIAGNVVTGEMTEELLLSGADIVKVGIGSGSVCTTRIKTGVGYPQLSAIIECADAAHGLSGHIIADGGCAQSGDVAKAFGAGADFVMLGGMLAGHKESETKIYEINDKKYVDFYGLSSQKSMEKYVGEVAKYRATEGKEVLIPYQEDIQQTTNDIMGGIRSACTYVGAHKLKELTKRTTFILVNEQHNAVFDSNKKNPHPQ